MKQFKVLIADAQTMSRQLLELHVRASPGYQLLASVSDASALSKLCADHKPDLLLLDPCTPGGGLETAGLLKAEHPGLKLILITGQPEYSWPEKARAAGADSFWYKEPQTIPILTVMDRTMSGESVYPEAVPDVQIGLARSSDFTRRERDVLRQLLEGHNNRAIAEVLGISEHAVHYHINNMLSKTGYNNRIKLAVMVRKTGFVINAEEERHMK